MRSALPKCRYALPEYRSAFFRGKSYNLQEQEQQQQQPTATTTTATTTTTTTTIKSFIEPRNLRSSVAVKKYYYHAAPCRVADKNK
jgi:hypothetical protein